jgi:DNA-binding transcriptional ArsR family regulator
MHAFDVLGDPVRRRILELLTNGELPSGTITAIVQAEFGISQPAVSQHLKVLRDSGFAIVRPEGTRRLYAVDAPPFRELDVWLDRFRQFLDQRLDSLATELARGKRERRIRAATTHKPMRYRLDAFRFVAASNAVHQWSLPLAPERSG